MSARSEKKSPLRLSSSRNGISLQCLKISFHVTTSLSICGNILFFCENKCTKIFKRVFLFIWKVKIIFELCLWHFDRGNFLSLKVRNFIIPSREKKMNLSFSSRLKKNKKQKTCFHSLFWVRSIILTIHCLILSNVWYIIMASAPSMIALIHPLSRY